MTEIYLLVAAAVTVAAFFYGRWRAGRFPRGESKLHSLPGYHGWYMAWAVALPMIILLILWAPLAPKAIEWMVLSGLPGNIQPQDSLERSAVLRQIENAMPGSPFADSSTPDMRAAAEKMRVLTAVSNWLLLGLGLVASWMGFYWGARRLSPDFRARNAVERAVFYVLVACSAVAVLTTIGIVFSVLFESLRFFSRYPWQEFLFGLQWSPQMAIREDQVGQSGAFGTVPLIAGTTLIMVIAMLVAGPVGLFSAIFMAEYASPRFRAWAKPVLEILAGIPTVVFGFFAALTVAPLIRNLGAYVGLDVASESALAAGLVMGIMIIPFVSSLADDVMNAVPQSLRDGSYALGATKSETIKKVVLPAALPGIVSAMMLAVSRAVGETMIVVMAAGLAGKLTFNPLDAVTTFTVQIKTLLTGDESFDSTKTLSAFALGFELFFFTLILNIIALRIVQKYREQYD